MERAFPGEGCGVTASPLDSLPTWQIQLQPGLRRRGRELCDELPSHGDELDALYDGRLGTDLSVATTSPPSSFVLGP